jgi:8-oxo-dGTP pyrophosphatase MutT (NUDIX family)
MIYHEKPPCFKDDIDVANCFIECRDKDGYTVEILLLLRNRELPEPHAGEWCLPGGTQETGEFPSQCIHREVDEETGIRARLRDLVFLRRLYAIRDDEYGIRHFTFTLFLYSVDSKPDIALNATKDGVKEHTEYRWVTPETALKMNLIADLDNMIKLCYPTNI